MNFTPGFSMGLMNKDANCWVLHIVRSDSDLYREVADAET